MNQQQTFWADVHRGLAMAAVGVSVEEFVQDPIGTIAALNSTDVGRKWLSSRQADATGLAALIVDDTPYANNAAARRAGVQEHAAHERLAKRFQGGRHDW